MKLNRKNNKKGFTIVELVIVIGVIGILSAILIPTFANLTSQAQAAALKSDLAAVYSSYVADVADGYYGEEGVEKNKASKMYGQQEVALKKGDNYYVYGANGWDVNAKAADAFSSLTLLEGTGTGHKVAEYNGYSVYSATLA